MVRFRAYVTAFIILTAAGSVLADGGGGVRSPFTLGLGARQLGMGGAAVAAVNNSSSVYWNPAGLASVKRKQFELFYMTLFMDTRYECIALSYPTLSSGVFGVGICDLSSGDFIGRQNNHLSGAFSTTQDLFLIGYGFTPAKGLAIGTSVKGAYFNLAGYKDTGYGFDFGAVYSMSFINGLSAGVKVSDIYGPRIKLHTLEQRFPTTVRGGLSFDKEISGSNSLVINADVEKTENAGYDIYAGGEFGLKNMIFSRIGYMRNQLTLGVGLEFYDFKFDYAYTTLSEIEVSHRISLSFEFGMPVDIKSRQNDERKLQGKFDVLKQQEQQKTREVIRHELTLAEELENEGEYYKAIESYYTVLGYDDRNEIARTKVNDLFELIRQDITGKASAEYISGLANKQLETGNNYFNKRQYDKAAEQYQLALILDPDNQQAKEKLRTMERVQNNKLKNLRTEADRLIEAGEYEQALNILNQALRIVPDDKDALAKKERIHQVFKASEYLDKALKYFDQADYTNAGIMVDSVLALNPQSEGALGLKHQLVRFTADMTTLEDIKKNDTHWQSYIQGMEKYQAGEYDEAIKLWRSLIEYYPNNPNLKRNIDQAAERSMKK